MHLVHSQARWSLEVIIDNFIGKEGNKCLPPPPLLKLCPTHTGEGKKSNLAGQKNIFCLPPWQKPPVVRPLNPTISRLVGPLNPTISRLFGSLNPSTSRLANNAYMNFYVSSSRKSIKHLKNVISSKLEKKKGIKPFYFGPNPI